MEKPKNLAAKLWLFRHRVVGMNIRGATKCGESIGNIWVLTPSSGASCEFFVPYMPKDGSVSVKDMVDIDPMGEVLLELKPCYKKEVAEYMEFKKREEDRIVAEEKEAEDRQLYLALRDRFDADTMAEIQALKDAVTYADSVFRARAEHHKAKGTDDGYRKMEANLHHADRVRKALRNG
jgi:hypothetical protein